MNKTPIRTKFVKRLVLINDQLCFAALGGHELGMTLSALAGASPDGFTTSVFPANPYARRIYRQMKDLPAFAMASEQIELQMGVVTGVEHALAYVEEIESFRAVVHASPADGIAVKAAEDQLLAKMTEWSTSAPVTGNYRTLGYLRLLRNHYAHVNEEPTSAFAAYLANHSHHLQRFWTNGITDLGGVQFRTLPDGPLTPDNAFALMNVLRVMIEKIDQEFVATLTLADVIWVVAAEVFDRVKGNDRNPEPFARKVRAALREGYGEKFATMLVRRGIDGYLSHREDQRTGG
ncbi:hypothetical protein [Sphingomonas sp. 10B4]|uniref:hypothetical protein n=1 Tax=Sphingomonas sp. 10B4 TaxID=3048575 RepID=UPI002AB3F222|nr:hypothetical protein [Sphingomonas sp. 10B4]MDY7523132.1 hypothetical protein [Sphingomonas sp. 10B4]MEB0284428.1 hypothetical protein [Sphingomonas sp. 10B4]